MSEGLIGKISGAGGKTLIFSGVLPAVILVGGWTLLHGGASSLITIVQGLTKGGEQSAESITWLLWFCALTLLFYADRSLAIHVIAHLPGKLLAPARSFQRRREERRRWRCVSERRSLEWKATAARWYERSFEVYPWVPGWVSIPTLEQALEASGRARAVFERSTQESSALPVRQTERTEILIRGLERLRALSNAMIGEKAFQEELQQWRSLVASADVRKALDSASVEIKREWTAAFERFSAFPEEGELQPTALGNELAALDSYAAQRYGMDTGTLFIRLWKLLGKEEQEEVADARAAVESLLNLAIVFVAVGIIAGAGAVSALSTEWASACTTFAVMLGSFLVSAGSYRATLFAVRNLREKIVGAVDVHRLALLEALGFRPRTVQEELALFRELQDFFVQGVPRRPDRVLAYKTAEATPAAGKVPL